MRVTLSGVEVGKVVVARGAASEFSLDHLQYPRPTTNHHHARYAYTHARTRTATFGHYASPRYLRHMDNRLTRRRRSLFTQAQLATLLGCSTGTVKNMERSFLTDRQRDYLNAVGYSIAFYPRRKAKG